ncbi:uncharacterized protein LOC141643126 [Silene latifolia]|uniref:uncharacterized protein LOC141643126 n=1 Tax=Silene latifolia TaxID=37657 RepID=UPI003D76E2E1
MGMWEWLTSATDTLKHKTPDITPVTDVCWKSYDATRTATVHVSRAVTTKARVVHECLSDDQVRGDVTRVAKNLSFNGALYFVRSYGGGPIIDIVSRSLHDGKADSQKERLKDLEVKVAKLEKELSARKMTEDSQSPPKVMASTNQPSAIPDQRPESVLRNFMTQHFVGTRLFDNLVMPGPVKKENLAPRTEGNSE